MDNLSSRPGDFRRYLAKDLFRIRLLSFLILIVAIGCVVGLIGRSAFEKPPVSYSTSFQHRWESGSEYAVWLLGGMDDRYSGTFNNLAFVVIIERVNAPFRSTNPRDQIDGLTSVYNLKRDSTGSSLEVDGELIQPQDGIVFLHITDKTPANKFVVKKSQQKRILNDFNQRDPRWFVGKWQPIVR